MNAYTLTANESAAYDSGDAEQIDRLFSSLRQRFGEPSGARPVTTEVYHPDGTLIEAYSQIA